MRGAVICCLVVAVQSQCNINVDGKSVDFSTLQTASAATPFSWQDADFKYQVVVCGTAACGANTASICQVSLEYPPRTALSSAWDNGATWINSGGVISTTFNNGDDCNGVPRATNIKLTCAAGVTTATVKNVAEPNPCQYEVDMDIPGSLCPAGVAGGFSVGSILLVAFFPSFLIYLAVGCLYKRKKMGATSVKESIPNIDMWTNLPGLVKDGCKFTVNKIRRKGGTGDNYEEI